MELANNIDYCRLLKAYCLVNKQFYVYPYFEIIELSENICMRTFVDTTIAFRGYEQRYFSANTDRNICCKLYLQSVLENKSFQENFNLMKFDSIEELVVRLSVIGVY